MMPRLFQSEIRDSVVRKLLLKVREQDFGMYLRRMRLTKVRAFEGETVDFDFPVTALIATNGGGKSTILGAAAIAYKSIKPATFFPKSSLGDATMESWGIGYDLVDKTINPTQLLQRSARFKRSKWARDDLNDRTVLYFGIQRTVPAGERREFKKFATSKYSFSGQQVVLEKHIQEQVARILGKDVSHFLSADVSPSNRLYVGGDGSISYSEFHFGAGEYSILRMVSFIEAAPVNAIVLIEEIENGLHPVAVARMVEYLMDVADRKAIQSIFTTHSEDALSPLPPEAIWYSIEGKIRQGRISIEALRAISGRIDERLAIFVEDQFAKAWTEGIIRNLCSQYAEEIGVYPVSGDGAALALHTSHSRNPALVNLISSICILDGNSSRNQDIASGIIKLPGSVPESEVFDYVRANIHTEAMKLAIALHLPPESDARVQQVVESVGLSNRDPHLLFNQIGQSLGFIPAAIVTSAFVALWIAGNRDEADRIASFVINAVDATRNTTKPWNALAVVYLAQS
jgi:hypothetical protein